MTTRSFRNRKTSAIRRDENRMSTYYRCNGNVVMVSSLIARLGRCRAIMTHPKLLAPLIPDRKLVWGRVELQASIFALEYGRSLKQKTRTPCSSDAKKHRCLQSAQTDTSLGTPDYLSQDPINTFLPIHNKRTR